MSEADIKEGHRKALKFHEQSILVLGFLGGISFTTLSLVISERTTILGNGNVLGIIAPESYLDFLTAWLSVTGVVCVIASYQGQRAVAEWLEFPSIAESVAHYLVGTGYLAFIVGLILILLPFSPWGSGAAALAAFLLGAVVTFAPGHVPKIESGKKKK